MGDERSVDDREVDRDWIQRLARGASYALFFGCGLFIFGAVVLGVLRGIRDGRVWNPYTGLRHRETSCVERARRLVMDAERLRDLNPPWEGRYRDWVVRCRDSHGALHDLLRATRQQVQRRDEGDGVEAVPSGRGSDREAVTDSPK